MQRFGLIRLQPVNVVQDGGEMTDSQRQAATECRGEQIYWVRDPERLSCSGHNQGKHCLRLPGIPVNL